MNELLNKTILRAYMASDNKYLRFECTDGMLVFTPDAPPGNKAYFDGASDIANIIGKKIRNMEEYTTKFDPAVYANDEDNADYDTTTYTFGPNGGPNAAVAVRVHTNRGDSPSATVVAYPEGLDWEAIA